MKTLFIFLVIFQSAASFAGGRVGNGGDGVVCRDQNHNVVSIELLDLYEGRVVRGINAEMGGSQLSFMQKIEYVLNRLKKSESWRGEKYLGVAQSFQNNALFKKGIELVDIPDSDHVVLPRNCKVEQIVIQQEVKFPEDKKFIVNQDLWDAMANNSKAAMILHETIYSEALSLGHENSINTRYFNSIITSDRMNKPFTHFQMRELLTQVKFFEQDNRKLTMGVWSFLMNMSAYEESTFYPSGMLRSGQGLRTLAGDRTIKWKGQPIGVATNLEFYENGRLKKVSTTEYLELKTNLGETFEAECYPLTFWPNFEFKEKCRLTMGRKVKMNIQNQLVELSDQHEKRITFWDNMALRHFTHAGELDLKLANGLRFTSSFDKLNRHGLAIGGVVKGPLTFPLTNGRTVEVQKGSFQTYENGDLRLASIKYLPGWPSGATKPTPVWGLAKFWPKGVPKELNLRRYVIWPVQGKQVLLMKNIGFYENGNLAFGYSPYTIQIADKDGKVSSVRNEFCLDEQGFHMKCLSYLERETLEEQKED